MRVLVGVWMVFAAASAMAQQANQWIDFSKQYYQLKVAKDGIYKLSFQDLKNSGVPVAAIDPRLIQIYHRGTEQAILVKHNQQPANSVFEDGEYLEFYGRKNDGTLDAKLYQPQSAQPHSFYNLYSDTTSYFFTWSATALQGKRMEAVDLVNSTSIPKETYHTRQLLSVLTTSYAPGTIINDFIQQSYYNEGEGWTGKTLCTINEGCVDHEDFEFNQLTQTVPAGGVPKLEVQLTGLDDLAHRADIYVGPNLGSLRLVTTRNFTNFETPIVTADLAWTDVGGDGKVVVRVQALGVGGGRDRFSTSYVRLFFPENFNQQDVSEKNLRLAANPAGKSYIELPNAAAGTRVFDITDPNNVASIGTRLTAGVLSAVVPNTTNSRDLLVTSTTLGIANLKIKPVSFRNINPAAHNFLIVSHPVLSQSALGYNDPVKAYGGYRASAEGGGYDTLVVSIEQLYNQFNYGEVSPLAVYEFMKFMTNGGQPRFLFLIGKGREVYHGIHRKATLGTELRDLIPPAGFPASDGMYTMGLKGESGVPAVATGRLTATNSAQVAAYLNKVKETEATPGTVDWRKKLLHLSGGIKSNELTTFRSYMDGFASIAESRFLGGKVQTIGKHDPAQIQFIDITKEVNDGVNMVTFFGHSASNSTDIDIGYVSQPLLGFNNQGKYPAFLVNGCNAGEFFANGVNFGEDWMLASNKGARNFIANSSFGFDGVLRFYTETFYSVAFGNSEYINRGIGEAQQEVARQFLKDGGSSPVFMAQAQQMVLLGDPSLKMFAPSKPDYEVQNSSVSVSSFDGKPIHALSDSVSVDVIVKNSGLALDSVVRVRIAHRFDDQSVVNYDSVFNPIYFQDTLHFVVRRGLRDFRGNNQFEISIDAPDSVAEVNEENNKAVWSAFIPFNGTKNLAPHDFGIVKSRSVPLIFQNSDLLSPEVTYVVELDSTADFSSSFFQQREVKGKALIRQEFTLVERDSTVYYWRTKIKDQQDARWETTSFSYIATAPTGWAQMRKPQLYQNSLTGLVPDATPIGINFETTSADVFVRIFGSTSTASSLNRSFQVNNAEYYFSPQGFNCRNNTINLVAFTQSTLVPYRGVPFTFVNSNGRACGKEPQIINSFLPSEVETGNNDDLIQYVDNIAAGDSVILFSMGDAGFGLWSASVKNKLGQLGIDPTVFDSFTPGEPVIFLGRKGAAPGSAKVIRSDQPDPTSQELQLSDQLTGRIPSGSMRSTLIGPALKWRSIDTRLADVQLSDDVRVDLHGVKKGGAEEVLLSDVANMDLASIDATTYPFLRLYFHTSDITNLTPSFVNKWIVHYDPAPEGFVFLNQSSETTALQEGQTARAKFGFVNISSVNFPDSLSVDTRITTQATQSVTQKSFRIKSPLPGDSSLFEFTLPTVGKRGLNDVEAVVNKLEALEEYLPNNLLVVPSLFNVLRDQVNPSLDVTIDGRYVVNGDFVSPDPAIRIRVRDENPYLTKTDTVGINVLLQYPCTTDCEATPIYFSRADVTWSVSSQNEITIQFNPKALDDGLYTLYVQAVDASGNKSGDDFYEVDFTVKKDPGVRFTEGYPNPSSSIFYFDVTLSGNEAPSAVSLQLFNSQGQQVGSFSETDFPALHIGTNQLQWNTLADGRKYLPDGIYFYRLSILLNGADYTSTGRLLLAR